MYKPKELLSSRFLSIIGFSALCFSSISYAATLGQRAVYTVNILPAGDLAEVGQCSAFTFGDVSTICAAGSPSVFEDNQVSGVPALTGGDGILDGLAGTMSIQTGYADGTGNNTFTVLSYQMDPYLATAGGVFKTTMTAPDGSNSGVGTFDAQGNMTLDLTGRTGVAQFFEAPPPAGIGIAAWNIDDSASVAGNGDPVSGLYQVFTTGASTNYDPAAGGVNLTLTGRAIGDANTDTILDAVLVSVGNVGSPWLFFDGTPYSEAFNVQFVLVSADPVAVDDTVVTTQAVPVVIDIANDLLVNDSHAADETLTLDSATQPAVAGSNIVVDIPGGTITYTPDAVLLGAGADSFTYTVSDLGGQTDTATVLINIATGNPPVANDDPGVVTNEDNAVIFDPVAGIDVGTVADTDPDPGETATLVISAFDATSANSAAITSTGGNNLTYTPPPNFNGPDTFTYTIQDTTGFVDTATVTVTVASVNDTPVCSDVSFTTAVDAALDINIADELLSTTSTPPLCTDIEGDGLTLATFDPVSTNGGAVASDGTMLTYTPPAGFEGLDTFTFTATDGTNPAAAQTVTVNVANPTLGNFTMLDKQGNTFGGTNDVLFEWDGTTFNADETDTSTVATMRSVAPPNGHPFFGSPWFAHHIRVFGPGTYTFDTTCNKTDFDTGVTTCNRPFTNAGQTQQFLTVTVGPGQIGALVFFDYTVTEDIDVFLVWDQNAPWDDLGAPAPKNQLFTGDAGLPPDVTTDWEKVSTDGDGDGIVGVAMIDGSFIGFSANFNIGPGGTAPPLPPITSEASDTSLDSSIFSINIWGLVVGLFSILGLRSYRKNK